MEIRLISLEGLGHRHVDELDQLLAGPDLVWVDVPSWDDEAAQVLGKLLRLHPRAMQDCAHRNPVPKVHVYPGGTCTTIRQNDDADGVRYRNGCRAPP